MPGQNTLFGTEVGQQNKVMGQENKIMGKNKKMGQNKKILQAGQQPQVSKMKNYFISKVGIRLLETIYHQTVLWLKFVHRP